MLTQLPSKAAQIASQECGELAHYLANQLKNLGSGTMAYDAVPLVMRGALAIAALCPFDPKDLVSVPSKDANSAEPSHHSLLAAVLMLENPNRLVSTKTWPRDLSQFGPHLQSTYRNGDPAGVDPQWVAAALTAAGCNPWTDPDARKGGLPHSMFLALSHGYAGLVDCFMDCPGAPSAQQLADTTIPGIDPKNVVEFLAQEKKRARVIEVLAARGMRLTKESQVVEIFPSADPACVQALSEFGLPEISPAAKSKILGAWKNRSGSSLYPDDIEKMQLSAWGQVDKGMEKSSLEINKYLGASWGVVPNSSEAYAYGFSLASFESVAARNQIKAGPQAGQWSVFAAATASRIRQANADGALGWSTPLMLRKEFDDKANVWVKADCAKEPYRGCLKNAIGFEWRPGILIDGVVALSLYGQRGKNPNAGSEANRKSEDEVVLDIEQFRLAAGIDDLPSWARTNGPSAAAFTCQVLKSPKVNAARCCLFTWATALRRLPAIGQAISDEQKASLLQSLTSRFDLTSPWVSSMHGSQQESFDAVAGGLFPSLTRQSFMQDLSLEGPKRTAALIWALARSAEGGGTPLDQLTRLEAASPKLSADEFQIVSTWLNAKVGWSPEERQEGDAILQRWCLQQHTPGVSTMRRGSRL